MSFVVKLHGVVVGRSELEHRDAESRRAWGAFRPGLGYELVEPIFALRGTAAESPRYREARETLALELHDASGALVDTSLIEIIPTGTAAGGLILRAAVPDEGFWSNR